MQEGDTTAPAVSITAPAPGTSLSGTVLVSAAAHDDVGVTKVEFFSDGSLLATTTVAPYRFVWDTSSAAGGSHTLFARAYDGVGNVAQSSAVPVTVSQLPITATMSVSINGSTAVGTVAIAGAATSTLFGLDLQILAPNGATIASLAHSTADPYATPMAGSTSENGTFVSLPSPANFPGFGSGDVLVVTFANVPAGATASEFGASLLAVYASGGGQIQ